MVIPGSTSLRMHAVFLLRLGHMLVPVILHGGTGRAPPKFVGTDYYCESANTKRTWKVALYSCDLLWDGWTCTGNEPPCCKPRKLPYFHKVLGRSTCDNIELRLCNDQGYPDEEVPIQGFELYTR